MDNSKRNLCESPPHNLVFAGAMLLLLCFIVASDRPLFFDEPYYLNDVGCIQHFGVNFEMMLHLQNAPGPLFALMHTFLAPITGLELPWVRLVSWLLMFITCVTLGSTLRLIHHKSSLWSGFSFLLFPTTFLVSGLALTEAPALLCFTASLYLLVRVLATSAGTPLALWLSAAAGLAFGLAIFGRQTLIPAGLAFAIALGCQRRWKELALVVALSAPFPGLMLYSWGSLRPPYMDTLGKFHPEFSFDKLALCVAYLFVVVSVIAPGTLRHIRRSDAYVFIGAAILNLGMINLSFLPMRFLTERLFPWLDIAVAERAFGSVLFGLAACGTVILARSALAMRGDKTRLAFAVAGFAGALSISTIGFTGKYLVPVVPLLVLAYYPGQLSGWFPRLVQYGVLSVGVFSAFSELVLLKVGGGSILPDQTIYIPRLLEDFPDYSPKGEVIAPVRADQLLNFGPGQSAN